VSLFGDESKELLPYDFSVTYKEWALGDLNSEQLFKQLETQIAWETHQIRMFGKVYDQPRLIAWYGEPNATYSYSGTNMVMNDWTPPLLQLKEICEEESGHRFNSVLLNLYRDGNDKVGWHSDNEPELGSEPTIASLSLGAPRRFKFRHRETKEVVEKILANGSLVIMSGLSQKCWEHEIPRQAGIKGPRINLTFRNVYAKK
jgi:alkylated DNA repair dioxygenase AlkB